MKTIYCRYCLLFFLLLGCASAKNLTFRGSPVVDASNEQCDYRIGDVWYRGQWTIAPQLEHDTLKLTCYNPAESFEFKTDVDSIEFKLKSNSSEDFYVRLTDIAYAHTVVQGIAFEPDQLEFEDSVDSRIAIKYQTAESEYLKELKNKYPLEYNRNEMTDTEVVLEVLNWTNNRWNHNGNQSPSKSDAITILKEAEEGKEFPCFAYAIVLRDQLTALDFKARTIYLKTKDAQTRKWSPGHVATEVYLPDLQKWVFVDGQFNVMPMRNGTPLNAVEFQNTLGNHFEELELRTLKVNPTSKRYYMDFVYDYLFYIDTSLDNRYNATEQHLVDGKGTVMLVPVGVDNLTRVEFWDLDVDYCVYTNSYDTFYAKPL